MQAIRKAIHSVLLNILYSVSFLLYAIVIFFSRLFSLDIRKPKNNRKYLVKCALLHLIVCTFAVPLNGQLELARG